MLLWHSLGFPCYHLLEIPNCLRRFDAAFCCCRFLMLFLFVNDVFGVAKPSDNARL